MEESEKFLQVQSLKKKSRVPTLDNYSLPEFEEFKRKIMDKRQEEIPISVLETEISKIDLANLLQNIVGDNIIILMIKYLMLYQYQNKKKYNSQLHTKNEFFLLKIRVELSPRFKIKVRNLFGSKTVTNLTPYKSIFFIFKLDNRWMVTSYMPAENMAYIWDFLDPMFSNIPKETISSVVDSLIKKYLGRMKIKKSFVSSARNNFYSSKSLEILYVLATHFFDLRANPLYLTPDESTLSKFSKKLVWLIFGLMKLKTDKIYFLDFFDPNAANQNDQANQPNHDEIYNRKKKQQFVQEHNNSVPHQDQEQKRVSLPTKNSFTSDALTDKKQSLFQPDITNINRKSNFSVADKMILKNRNSSLPAVKLHPILEKNKISNMVSQLLPTNLGTFFPNINPSKNIETNFDLYKNKSTSVFQTLMDKLGLDDHNNDFTLKQADKFLNKNNETISEKSDKTFSVINFLVENPMLLKKMKMKLNQNPRLRKALKSAYEKDLKEKILDRLNEEYNDLCMEEEMNGFAFTYIN